MNTVLVVKEHPNDLGCRGPRVLRQYASLPRTILIRPDVLMGQLLDRVDVVVSVAGTVLMEAALKGVPAIALSDVYFTGLSGITRALSPYDLIGAIRRSLSESGTRAHDGSLEMEDRALLEEMYRGSFEGFIHHPRIVPAVMSPANLEKIREACAFFHGLLQGGSR